MSSKVPTALDVDVPGLGELYIGGEWVEPAEHRSVELICPSTEEPIAEVADPSPVDADLAVAAARRAFDEGEWPRMAIEERVRVCARLCDELEARLDDLNRAWTWESGAPRFHGEMINSGAGVMMWRHCLEIAPTLAWRDPRKTPTGDVIVEHAPIGPVLAVLTYNGPVVLMGLKVIPALLAGCPVVIKPAPESALTTRIIAECARIAGFPEGVVSVLPAGLETSQHLVSHDGIDVVALTGGTEIAIDVQKRTADRLARTILELGGKSPAIVCEDVDLDEVMSTLVDGASGFCGQVCVSLSRILAPRSRYDEVVDALASAYTALRVGDPFDPQTERGPLAVERARTRTEQWVERATRDGATIAAGGKRPPDIERGWYYEPTVLSDVDNSMAVAQEEVFGPVTCVIPYGSLDEAVAIANDTKYGLAASVYSRDTQQALAIANRIRSGSVAINLAGICLTEPFGGVKLSGWGRECGAEGILEFTESKQILLSGSYLEL